MRKSKHTIAAKAGLMLAAMSVIAVCTACGSRDAADTDLTSAETSEVTGGGINESEITDSEAEVTAPEQELGETGTEQEDVTGPGETGEPGVNEQGNEEGTTEPEEAVNYILDENGNKQPAVHYEYFYQFREFVESLELEEAVFLFNGVEKDVILYNGYSIEKGEDDFLYIYVPKEVSDYTYTGASVTTVGGSDNYYGVTVIQSQNVLVHFAYEDGTEEEISINITEK